MKRSTGIMLAILVVVVLILIVYVAQDGSKWGHKNYWTARFFESPAQVYRRSNGTFDLAAQMALDRLGARTNPTPAEHLLAATIIARNVLGHEYHPERDADGAPTIAAINQGRHRRMMYDQARGRYIAALDGFAAPREDRIELLLRRDAEDAANAAAEFVFGGARFFDMRANDWGLPILEIGIDAPVLTRVDNLRRDIVAARRAAAESVAAEQGGARGAAVETYVTLATQNTHDGQNVHDPSVLACLRGIVQRLRIDQGPLEGIPSTEDVSADIDQHGEQYSRAGPDEPGRPARVIDALAVIAKTTKGERVVAVDATDEECLRRIWHRASHPQNVLNANAIRQALFDGLVDSWEDDGLAGRRIMCVNGRTAHILGAIVMLDFDKRNWEVKRLEQFKNDIYASAKALIQEMASVAAASDDSDTSRAGRTYLATTAEEIRLIGEVPEAAIANLSAEMQKKIAEMVDAYVIDLDERLGTDNVIPSYMIGAVKQEAIAAAA
jgi:hypothetical protein